MNAVYDLKTHLVNEYDSMNGEYFIERGGDWTRFEHEMDRWANDMKKWLGA